jgi:hypothetical protein
MRCDDCRDLLLDHLNGLLDPPEAAALDAHLSGCAGCSAVREQAARAQQLFARAARFEFPHVRFTPPTDAADRNGAESAVPSSLAPAPKPGRVSWARWAVAAAVLVGVAGTVVPVAGRVNRYETARREADRAAQHYADARLTLTRAVEEANRPVLEASAALTRLKEEREQKLAAAERQLAAAVEKQRLALAAWEKAEAVAAAADRDRTLKASVVRPTTLQPGVANNLAIDVTGDAPVEAEVRDSAGAVLFRQTFTRPSQTGPAKPNPVRMHLPASVWANVKPQSELYLAVGTVDPKTGARTPVMEPLRLFGPEYATFLTTDKSVYRPGERLFFRSLTLDRVSFRPPARGQHLRFELRPAGLPKVLDETAGLAAPVRVAADGTVEPVRGPDGQPVRGTGCGEFVLPHNLADGEYTLVLTELDRSNAEPPTIPVPVTRTVRVRTGEPERFHKRLWFAAASFGPGQEVVAFAELTQNGKPVKGAMVLAAAVADGQSRDAQPVEPMTDANGRVEIRVELPPKLSRGDVRLRVTFRNPANASIKPGDPPQVIESVTERVPVVGTDLVVEFFPEGGKLVAGVPNRVYVRATTRDGHSADVRGVLTDGKEAVGRVETVTDATQPGSNRGIGAFTFTPRLGGSYWVSADKVAGGGFAGALAGTVRYRLPAVEPGGVVATVLDPVTKPGQPVRVQLYSVGEDRKLVIGAYTRGRLADTARVAVPAAKPGDPPAEVRVLANADPRGGVVRITVFEDPAGPEGDLVPRVERLVYRTPAERLDLSFNTTPAAGGYTPGSPVDLTLRAADEKGNPVPAIVWVSAVNSAVAADPHSRLMPTHFLLAGEVQSSDALENADFLLTDHPQAAAALDRVLATQGWRKITTPPRLSKDDLVVERTGDREHRRLAEECWPQYVSATDAVEAAKHDRDAVLAADPRRLDKAQELAAAADQARKAAAQAGHTERVSAAAARVNAEVTAQSAAEAADAADRVRSWAWFALGGCGLLVVGLVGFAVVRPGGTVPLAVAAVAAVGMSAYLAAVAARDFPRPAMPIEVAEVAPTAVLIPNEWGVKRVQRIEVFPPPPGVKRPAGPVREAPNLELKEETLQVTPRGAKVTVETVRKAASVLKQAEQSAAGYAAERIVPLPERIRSAIIVAKPLVVREYAAPRPGSDGTHDLAPDTVLWQPLIVLPADGTATVRFHLGNAPGYEVTVAGYTPDGRLGAVRGTLPVERK